MRCYFNEFDPAAAEWIRELQRAGHAPEGTVDERSITEVQAVDVVGYRRCHFFGGIAGWELALQLAGWDDSREIWTGSCPCPPFSAAGKKKHCPECGGKSPVPCPRRTGYFICSACEHAWHADARHLWPEFWRLIEQCRPATVVGEQVAGKDGLVWFAGVRASLERIGYAVGCADLCSAGAGEEAEGRVRRGDSEAWERITIGAPHIRQRLFWVATRVADADAERRGERDERERGSARPGEQAPQRDDALRCGGVSDGLADTKGSGGWSDTGAVSGRATEGLRIPQGEDERGTGERARRVGDSSAVDGLADSECERDGNHRPGEPGEAAAGVQGADRERERVRADARKRRRVVFDFTTPDGRSLEQLRAQGALCPSDELVDTCERAPDGVGDAPSERREGATDGGTNAHDAGHREERHAPATGSGSVSGGGFWSDFDIVHCWDGKARRIPAQAQPGFQRLLDGLPDDLDAVRVACEGRYPLAGKVPNRTMLLRGYGNAINPVLAAEFIRAFMEAEEGGGAWVG